MIGLGTFRIKKRAEGIGRNPRNGEKIQIPSKITTKFKPSKPLKRRINK